MVVDTRYCSSAQQWYMPSHWSEHTMDYSFVLSFFHCSNCKRLRILTTLLRARRAQRQSVAFYACFKPYFKSKGNTNTQTLCLRFVSMQKTLVLYQCSFLPNGGFNEWYLTSPWVVRRITLKKSCLKSQMELPWNETCIQGSMEV